MRISRPTSLAALLVLFAATAQGQDQAAEDELASPLDQTVPVAEETGLEDADASADENGRPADGTPDENVEYSEEKALREFARFRELLAERNFDEADVSAKRVVEMSIAIYGAESHATARALNNLAIVQHNNKQYEAAIQNFSSAIEILEIVEDRLNSQLVNPLRGLGAAQLNSGRPDLASNSFSRATHITHVNEGPHNIEQVEILEALAEANVRLGDVETARNVLNRIHALNVRHFENDKMGLLPSLMRRAEWQHRAGHINDERITYRNAIRIIETASGKNDPRLVQPLIRLGKSFYYLEPRIESGATQTGGSGEVYFKRAVRIAESAEDFPWLELAMTKLAMADYYTYAEIHNRSRRMYREVWDELSTDEDRLEMRRELMERPIALGEEAQLPQFVTGDATTTRSPDMRTGVIRVDYTVSERGRVRDIRTEASPAEFTDMQRMVHREIRRRIFRPVIADGVPVDSTKQVFEHEFFYRDSDLDGLRQKNAAPGQSGEKTKDDE